MTGFNSNNKALNLVLSWKIAFNERNRATVFESMIINQSKEKNCILLLIKPKFYEEKPIKDYIKVKHI